MKAVLFIHQSAELYGSDKTLLFLVKNLDKTNYFPVVVIPSEGPLKTELEKTGCKVVIAPVLKLYRKMFSPANLFRFIRDIQNGLKTLKELHQQHHFDVIYSNTLAVLLGTFFARKSKIKHLWHVHEIIESPKLFTKLFVYLLKHKSTTTLVYNSLATATFWNQNPEMKAKTHVVHNGLEIPKETPQDTIVALRKDYFKVSQDEVVIGLVGRISRWKGQLVLLKAFEMIQQNYPQARLVFIGSPPPAQNHFLETLQHEITSRNLNEKAIIIPFQETISAFWSSIDIAVVASTEPEPFGLVAVEAMLAKKPVIGANHGGLTEIIEEGQTGFLVTPKSETDLAEKLALLIQNKTLREEMGEKGNLRATKYFSVESYVSSFEKLF